MQEELTVRILSGCRQAREVNPLGEKPNTMDVQKHQLDNYFKSLVVKQWQESESKLRTFEIEMYYTCQSNEEMGKKCDIQCEHCKEYYKSLDVEHNLYEEGSIHQAKLLQNGKILIL